MRWRRKTDERLEMLTKEYKTLRGLLERSLVLHESQSGIMDHHRRKTEALEYELADMREFSRTWKRMTEQLNLTTLGEDVQSLHTRLGTIEMELFD